MTTQLHTAPPRSRADSLDQADVRYALTPHPHTERAGSEPRALDMPPSPVAKSVPLTLLWLTPFAVFVAWLAVACYAFAYLVVR